MSTLKLSRLAQLAAFIPAVLAPMSAQAGHGGHGGGGGGGHGGGAFHGTTTFNRTSFSAAPRGGAFGGGAAPSINRRLPAIASHDSNWSGNPAWHGHTGSHDGDWHHGDWHHGDWHHGDWHHRYSDRRIYVYPGYGYYPGFYPDYYPGSYYYPSDDYYYDAPVTTEYYETGTVGVPDDLGAEVQRALARRGYYRGPIDGNIGPMSRAAIRAYQADRGLPVTGRVDGPLVRALHV